MKEHFSKGWIELLHYKQGSSFLQALRQGNLNELKEDDYDVVGSPLPLGEYSSVFDVYEQFAKELPGEFGIPRTLRPFDVINKCVNDYWLGSLVITMVLVPNHKVGDFWYPDCKIHSRPNHPLSLVRRSHAFRSRLRPLAEVRLEGEAAI